MTAQESIDHLKVVAETYPVGVLVDRLKAAGSPAPSVAPVPTAAPAAAPSSPTPSEA